MYLAFSFYYIHIGLQHLLYIQSIKSTIETLLLSGSIHRSNISNVSGAVSNKLNHLKFDMYIWPTEDAIFSFLEILNKPKTQKHKSSDFIWIFFEIC